MEAIKETADLAPTQLRYDYEQIPAGHRGRVMEAAEMIYAAGRVARKGAIRIGQELREVKKRLGYGQFGEWLRAEFDWSERTAERMISVAQYLEGKSDKLSDLGDSVLYLLAAPSTPDEVRVEVEQAAAEGKTVTVEFAKEATRKHRPEPVQYAAIWQLEIKVNAWLSEVVGESGVPSPDSVLDNLKIQGTEPLKPGGWMDLLSQWIDAVRPVAQWRKSDLIQALNNVREQRRQAKLQAASKVVYPSRTSVEPVKAESVPVLHHLESNRLQMHGFSLWEVGGRWRYQWDREDRSIEHSQLFEFVGDVHKAAWAKLEQLGIDRWHKGEPDDPEPTDAPSADELAAMAAVAAEREEEERERLAIDDKPRVFRRSLEDIPPDLKRYGYDIYQLLPSENPSWWYDSKIGGAGAWDSAERAIELARDDLQRRKSHVAGYIVGYLARDSSGDEFDMALEQATIDHLKEALPSTALSKTRREKIEARIRRLSKEMDTGRVKVNDECEAAGIHLVMQPEGYRVVTGGGMGKSFSPVMPYSQAVEAAKEALNRLRQEAGSVEPSDEDLEQEADDLQAMTPTVTVTISRTIAEKLHDSARSYALKEFLSSVEQAVLEDALWSALEIAPAKEGA